MQKINWSGYEWLTQERWGNYHPEKPIVWYDPSAVNIDDDGVLNLDTRYNPLETLSRGTGEPITIPVGTGLISCTHQFNHGYFEIEAMLPTGPYVWPAFWAWAFDSWPPEIDVFEGYTNGKSSYFNWSLKSLFGKFWAVNSNIHLGSVPDNYDLGAKSHWLGWKSPNLKYNRYGLDWTRDHITIFFNDNPVRHITNRKVIEQFIGKKMNIIINNSVQREYLNTNCPKHTMKVKYFKYLEY